MRKLYFLSILILPIILFATSCTILKEIRQPQTPTHYIPYDDLLNNPIYHNRAWEGRDAELFEAIYQIGKSYAQTHVYVPGETDCNDMAIDLWNMLHKKGITSVIAIGNLDMTGEKFTESNHAWLMIFTPKAYLVLEPTSGTVFIPVKDGGLACKGEAGVLYESKHSKFQYIEAWFYAKPSDLRADVGERW